MNTKNVFFAAQNRSRRTVPVIANNATNVPLATSVSAAAADLTLTPSGSFTATASRPPHSLQSKQHGCSLKTIRRHLAKAVTKAPGVTLQAAVWCCVTRSASGRCRCSKSRARRLSSTDKRSQRCRLRRCHRLHHPQTTRAHSRPHPNQQKPLHRRSGNGDMQSYRNRLAAEQRSVAERLADRHQQE